MKNQSFLMFVVDSKIYLHWRVIVDFLCKRSHSIARISLNNETTDQIPSFHQILSNVEMKCIIESVTYKNNTKSITFLFIDEIIVMLILLLISIPWQLQLGRSLNMSRPFFTNSRYVPQLAFYLRRFLWCFCRLVRGRIEFRYLANVFIYLHSFGMPKFHFLNMYIS